VALLWWASPAWAAADRSFDGTWGVRLHCGRAPDGALGYNWAFSAQVTGGNLEGHYRPPGAIPSGTLTGHIDAGGDALLTMQGLTSNPEYSISRVDPGSPIHYTVKAHFGGDHGSGQRVEGRPCELDFTRQ
jgi:hypothetical protein